VDPVCLLTRVKNTAAFGNNVSTASFKALTALLLRVQVFLGVTPYFGVRGLRSFKQTQCHIPEELTHHPSQARSSRAAALGAKISGAPRRHRNNQKYGCGKLRFSTREIISPKKIRCLGTRLQILLLALFYDKMFQEYRIERAPDY
jgi:hypothetical protein